MSKTVIITGGTKGIGAAISRTFHADGWSVLVCARNDNGLAGELGERARFQALDVTVEADHMAAAKTAMDWTGTLDAYVNCAGVSAWRPVGEVDNDFWQTMIDTNLSGTYWGCKVAAGNLSNGGAIVNVSSLAGKRGSANNSVYCAAKFAVNGVTQSLAKELGGQGIRVNAVCPVYVETDGVFEALEDSHSPTGGNDISAYLKDFAKNNTALKRLPTADEVADLCLYLAGAKSSAITGQCINVDCGVMPQ